MAQIGGLYPRVVGLDHADLVAIEFLEGLSESTIWPNRRDQRGEKIVCDGFVGETVGRSVDEVFHLGR